MQGVSSPRISNALRVLDKRTGSAELSGHQRDEGVIFVGGENTENWLVGKPFFC